jgi:SagB-type dehydrogenase family enzyme
MEWCFNQNEENEKILSTLYHNNSSHNPSTSMLTMPRKMYTKHVPDLEQSEEVLLETDLTSEKESKHALSYVLKHRKSSWQFNPTDMSLNDLRHLLSYSFGLRSEEGSFRTYPAGGQFYPLKIYFVPTKRTIDNGLLEPAVYKYNVEANRIVKIKTMESTNINQLTAGTDIGNLSLDNAQLVVFLVSDGQEIESKYLSLAYRLTLLEAGHMAQNFLLMATDIGLASVPLGGFYENKINKLLGLKTEQRTIYVLLGG